MAEKPDRPHHIPDLFPAAAVRAQVPANLRRRRDVGHIHTPRAIRPPNHSLHSDTAQTIFPNQRIERAPQTRDSDPQRDDHRPRRRLGAYLLRLQSRRLHLPRRDTPHPRSDKSMDRIHHHVHGARPSEGQIHPHHAPDRHLAAQSRLLWPLRRRYPGNRARPRWLVADCRSQRAHPRFPRPRAHEGAFLHPERPARSQFVFAPGADGARSVHAPFRRLVPRRHDRRGLVV